MGLASGLCLFIEAECAALIRLQVITLSEQVLALDLACAVGAFVSLPIAFLFSHLFLQLPPPPPPLLPYCHAHACARGHSGWWGRHFSPGCLAEFLLCSGLDSVFLALEHVRAPFAAPFSLTPGRGGTGLVIKYAGYQCQWCQKSTPAAKVARKRKEGGREKGRKQAPCVAGTGLVVVCPSPLPPSHVEDILLATQSPFLPHFAHIEVGFCSL